MTRLFRAPRRATIGIVTTGVVAIGIVAIGMPALGAISFESPEEYPVGQSPHDVEVYDFNGDVWPDLVTANQESLGISLLVNLSGNLSVFTEIFAGGGVRQVACGDVDGDGDADLVVGYAQGSTHVGVITNIAHGAFSLPVQYGTFGSPDGLFLHDIDGDADLDVIVGDASTMTVRVYRNDGGGALGPVEVYTILAQGAYPSDYALADVDGDQLLDLVIAAPLSSSPAIYLLGQADGVFAGPFPLPTSAGGAASVAAGDLDGDQDVDLAFIDISFADELRIVFNLGGGVWSAAVGYSPGFAASLGSRVRLADVDGNGALDPVVIPRSSGFTPGRAGILLNDGTGTMGEATTMLTGGYGSALLVQDLDGDAAPDIAVTDQVDDRLWVLRNSSATGVPSSALPAAPLFEVTGPNPTRRGTELRYGASPGSRVRLVVVDVAGRLVRTLLDGRAPGGAGVIGWDGRDGAGRLSGPGVYMARFESDAGTVVKKLTVIR